MDHLNLPLPWIMEAKKHIGLKEIPGPKHNATILSWLSQLKAWWKEDETPWCGVFVAHCFRVSDMQLPKLWMRAKEWGNGWGTKLNKAAPGCVVVFDREGGGHVGFVLGITKSNELVVLGGNQSNSVNIAKFSMDRVFGYYWPRDYTLPNSTSLPILSVAGGLSFNEA